VTELDARRERREARRRVARRRRRVAGLVALAAAAAIAAVALAATGPGTAHAPAARPPAKARTVTLARHDRAPVDRCLAPYTVERAPILEYHVIAPAPAGAPFPLLYVPPSLFAAQMRALHAAGYHAVTLDQLWANWHEHKRLPCGKPIVLSFDNGYETQFQYAAPVLAKLGWVGVENLQLFGLDWANGGISHHEIRELIADGWELATQGWDHADMVTQDAAGLRLQIVDARRKLKQWFPHQPVNWFCYPSGQYDPTVIAALRAAGFRGSTTEYWGFAGPADDPYALPRMEVQPTQSPSQLVTDVAGMAADPPPPDQHIS
jgi:peptidoglycan/xylan/chitin deacetylase (PgdA/CDA1 family)